MYKWRLTVEVDCSSMYTEYRRHMVVAGLRRRGFDITFEGESNHLLGEIPKRSYYTIGHEDPRAITLFLLTSNVPEVVYRVLDLECINGN